jgi:16S rRNA processing protein RimM
LLLSFKGFTDRNAVEKLRDVLVYAEIDINEPGEDEDDYHVLQLIGCNTYLEDGTLVGEITDVLNLPGQDVLVIAGPTGEVLIPFVRALVPVVDIKNKKLTVIPPIIEGKVQ